VHIELRISSIINAYCYGNLNPKGEKLGIPQVSETTEFTAKTVELGAKGGGRSTFEQKKAVF
jgi:hypothetical protein